MGIRKFLTQLFIVFHFTAFFAWSMPEPNLFVLAYSDVTGNYLKTLGLWQGWSMFAPNPPNVNSYIDAKIRLANGKVLHWEVPRIDLLPISQRQKYERWNQWNVMLGDEEETVIREDAARYIARIHFPVGKSIKERPIQVTLRKHWSEIPKPRPGNAQPFERTARHANHKVILKYTVQEGDLL